jgi:hypothetical protein
LPSAARAVALRVYDVSHKVVRAVTSATQAPAHRPPLPVAERWYAAPERLDTSAGMHRFIWNLAWDPSGKPENSEPEDGEGRTPHPPRVAPGSYTVELEVNGESVSREPLLLTKDPRSPATQAQFALQFATSHKIYGDSLESRRALSEIAAVNKQLDQMNGSAAANAPLIAKVKELRAALERIVAGNSGLDAATMQIITALNAVESSDRPAPSQALAVYRLGRTASRAKLKEWAVFKGGPLAIFNQELQSQGMTAIAVRKDD